MRRVTLLLEGWQFSCAAWQRPPSKVGYSEVEWQRATVPGHVHTDLVTAGVIADPFARLNELGCQWVDDQDWHFRTEFEFKPDPGRPRRCLRFEGLDTVCRILLNGTQVGTHENMFVPLEIDVTDALSAGSNVLRIEFTAATRVGIERRARYFESEGIAADTVRFEPRAFVRKAQYMYGWDWGPCLVSAGIWRPVELIEFGSRILDVQVSQRHHADGSVELTFATAQEGNGTAYHYVEGHPDPILDGEPLRISQPRLWWPSNAGRPELYHITSLLAERPPRALDETVGVLDRLEQRIGLRTIELLRVADAHGESFEFSINRQKIYMLGANWIPDDSFPSRVSRERLLQQLRVAQSLGMNMLRVWGGGFYESDDFYELCDELGLLVWQDFPYACSYYPDDEAACQVARDEATTAIRRLRNHASLALWCGNNENQMMRDSGWGGAQRHPKRYHGERIYSGVLPQVVAELDRTRPYIASSPIGKLKANSDGDGDQHYWDVWHGRGDWRYYADSRARFCSEFGFASAPGRDVWAAMDDSARLLDREVHDVVARWHNKTGKAFAKFLGLVEQHYRSSTTIEDWLYHSQLNQRDALRFAIEHFRRSEFCRGTLIWQLNDCWPVQSWAVVDSAGRMKPAAFELRRLYAPLLASLERRGNTLRLWGILDNVASPREASFALEIRSLIDGRLLERRARTSCLQAGERRVLESVDLAAYDPLVTLVLSEVEGCMSCALLCEPKELVLQPCELMAEILSDGIAIESTGPVLDLWLADQDSELDLVENCQTFACASRRLFRGPGRPKRLVARSLAGLHPIRFK